MKFRKEHSFIFVILAVFFGWWQFELQKDENEDYFKNYPNEEGGFYYDYMKGCDFQELPERLIAKSDWDNILQKKFITKEGAYNDPNSSAPILSYTYNHNNLYVELSKNSAAISNSRDEYAIDVLKLSKNRVPGYINKKYILSEMNIRGLQEPVKTLSIGCDCATTKVTFSNEKIDSIELIISDSCN